MATSPKTAATKVATKGSNSLGQFEAQVKELAKQSNDNALEGGRIQMRLGLLYRTAIVSGGVEDTPANATQFATWFDSKQSPVSAGVFSSKLRSFAHADVVKAFPKADYSKVEAYVNATKKADRGGRSLFDSCYAVNSAVKKTAKEKPNATIAVTDAFIKAATPAKAKATPAATATPAAKAKEAIDEIKSAIKLFSTSAVLKAAKLTAAQQKALDAIEKAFA